MSKIEPKKNESKFSRVRRKKPAKINESLEDFEDKKGTLAKKVDGSSKLDFSSANELPLVFSSTRIDNESTANSTAASFIPSRKDQLPPCPLCGKFFQEGQELSRSQKSQFKVQSFNCLTRF
jgi:hypothetical protein